jgi:putative oxidoreductase
VAVYTHVHGHPGPRSQWRDSGLQRHGHWLVRAGAAAVVLGNGLYKILGPGVVAYAAAQDVPPTVVAIVAVAEVLTGAGLVAGALVRERVIDGPTEVVRVPAKHPWQPHRSPVGDY